MMKEHTPKEKAKALFEIGEEGRSLVFGIFYGVAERAHTFRTEPNGLEVLCSENCLAPFTFSRGITPEHAEAYWNSVCEKVLGYRKIVAQNERTDPAYNSSQLERSDAERIALEALHETWKDARESYMPHTVLSAG